ncbi:MAG TPA: NHL repeat-containing protein [Patescibacteria group bacterium]|nr:NHL repeat-containing protein [Patescibacteria group bacterium]
MRTRWLSMSVALLAAHATASPAAAAEVLKLRHAATLYADAGEVPLRVPQGVGCGAGDTILVADSGNGRVLRVEISGALARVTGIVKLAEIVYPIRVDGDATGAMVVLDGKSRRLARVAADGKFGGWIEIPHAGGTANPVIRSFALGPHGAVLAADVAGRRVVQISATGSLDRSIALPGEARGITDVALDGRGSVLALDGVGRRVWVARPGDAAFAPLSGSLAEDLDYPGALDVDPSGRLLVADLDGGGVVMLGPDGSFRGRQLAFGSKQGLLRYPTDLCSTRRGLVVIADRENQRVQVFAIGE